MSSTTTTTKTDTTTTKYSSVVILGAGAAGICAGIKVKTKLKCNDFVIYDRHSEVGGTWWQNTYPGCGCDVPSVAYSYSFAQKHDWETNYPLAPELHEYFSSVARSYGLLPHVRFKTELLSASWDDERNLWVLELQKREGQYDWEVKLKDSKYKVQKGGVLVDVTEKSDVIEDKEEKREKVTRWQHECKVLISCVGGLVEPKYVNLKGKEDFQGDIFHGNVWDHSVDLTDKNVVVIGNGCSATQFIPEILPEVKSLTQIVRSSHWIIPQPQPPQILPRKFSQMLDKYIPGRLAAYRWYVYSLIELQYLAFRWDGFGSRGFRKWMRGLSEGYVKKFAPEKYWDILLPEFEVGCKRRIFDRKYIPMTRSPKFLLTRDEVSQLNTTSVTTSSGKTYPADVIILGTGFNTESFINPLKIYGYLDQIPPSDLSSTASIASNPSNPAFPNKQELQQHWSTLGGPTAYNTTAIHGFPNYFLVNGPNSATGYTSVILAIENVVNFACKLAGPIVRGEWERVEVKAEKEVEWMGVMQEALKGTVYHMGGCKSWYTNSKNWNGTVYPFSQIYFTYRSLFPTYSDFTIKQTPLGIKRARQRKMFIYSVVFSLPWVVWLLWRTLSSTTSMSMFVKG